MSNEDVRGSLFLWYLRLAQLVFSIIAVSVIAQNASTWPGLDCNVPARVAFNLACAVITLPFVIYLIFTTGRRAKYGLWRFWAQVGIDAFLFILWIAAAATSAPDCNDICGVCTGLGQQIDEGSGYWVYSGETYCQCYLSDDFTSPSDTSPFRKRSLSLGASLIRRLLPRAFKSAKSVAETASSIQAKQGFEGVLIFFFCLTLVTSLLIKYGLLKKKHHESPAEPQMAHAEQGGTYGQGVDVAGHATNAVDDN